MPKTLYKLTLMTIALAICVPSLGLLPFGQARAQTDVTKAAEFYEDAVVRFEKGDYEEAIVQLKNVRSLDPDNLPARVLMGRAYMLVHNPLAAETELLAALSTGVDESLVLVPLARAYLDQGKYEDVFALQSRDGSVEVRSDLIAVQGQAYLETGLFEEADQAFEEAIALNPANPLAYIGSAKAAVVRNRLTAAADFAYAAADLAPEMAEPWYVTGEIRRVQGDLQGALAGYDKALDLDPRDTKIRLSRAATLVELDRNDDALSDIKHVQDTDPEHPQALYLEALVLARRDDLDGARDALRRADAALAPHTSEHGSLLLLAGILSYSQGNLEAARTNLEQYLRSERTDSPLVARKVLAQVLLREGEPATAIWFLEQALPQAPDDAGLHALLGNAYLQNRQPDRAELMYEKASSLEPERADALTGLARSRIALGREEEALTDLEQVIALESGSSSQAVFLLSVTHLKKGDYDAALRAAEELIEREPSNPTSHNVAGLAWLGKADIAAARASFEHALELDASYFPAAHNLATVDIRENDVDSARKRYKAVLASNAGDFQAMTEIARIDAAQGHLEEAVRRLEKARAKDPSQITPQVLLAEIYLQSQELKKARELAEELASSDLTNLSVLFVLARTYKAMDKTENAVTVFRQMMTSKEFSAQWSNIIAAYLTELGDLEGARRSLQNVPPGDPGYVTAQERLVRIDLREGFEGDALERARKLQETYPTLAAGNLLEGDVLMKMGQLSEATQAYLTGQKKQPSAAATVRLFQAKRSAGAEAEAFAQLSQWVETHPNDQVTRRVLAVGYLQAGRIRESIEQHERLLETNPEDPQLLNNLAWLYQQMGDGRALAYAEQAHQLAPDDPATLDTFGWILVQQGKPGRGLLYLRKAHARAPKEPQVRYHLAVALNELGRDAEARRELQALLDSGQDFSGAPEAKALLRDLSGG